VHHVDPVTILSFSRLKCVPLPTPAEEKLSLPGLAFAALTKSPRLFQPDSGAAISTFGPAAEQREIDEVAHRVVAHVLVDAGVGGMRGGIREQGVAVRVRAQHELGAYRAAGAGAVLDHHRLAPHLLQLRRHRTADDVGRAAGVNATTRRTGLFG
jgi:hypothetical protein